MGDENIKLIIETILKDSNFKAGLKSVSAELNKAQKSALGFKSVIGEVMAGTGLGLGLASIMRGVVGVVKDAISTMIKFEQSVANAAAISGVSFDEISRIARKAGASTVFTASEAADALTSLARAGVKTGIDMENTLEPALRLATIGQLNLADATDKMVQTLNIFGMTTDEAGEVTDILAKSANSATTTVSEMTQAISYAGPIASQVGMTLEGTAFVLAELANNGITATRAGTTLRMALSNLIAPSKQARDIMEAYGITSDKLGVAMKDPVKLFELLRPLTANTADATRVLGVRAQSLIPIIAKSTHELETFRKSMNDAQGAAELEAKMLDTVSGQTKLLKSAWEEAILTFSKTDILKNAIKGLREAIVQITEGAKYFSDEWKEVTENLPKWWKTTVVLPMQITFYEFINTLFSGLDTLAKNELFRKIFKGAAEGIQSGLSFTKKSIRDLKIEYQDLAFGVKKSNEDSIEVIEKGGRVTQATLASNVEAMKREQKQAEEMQKTMDAYYKFVSDKEENKRYETERNYQETWDKIWKLRENDLITYEEYWKMFTDIREQYAEKIAEIEVAEAEKRQKLDDQVHAYISDNLSKKLKSETDAYKAAVDAAQGNAEMIEAINSKHAVNVTSIWLDQTSKMAGGLATIGNNIIDIEKNRLETMDKDDKDAYEKQKKRIIAAWQTQKTLRTAQAIIDTASGITKAMAELPFPLNLVQAGIVGASGATQLGVINSAPEPQFRSGADYLPYDMRAKVHKGERIIPAEMNPPGVSNADLMSAAMGGLNTAQISGGGHYNTSNNYNNSRTISLAGATFNLPGIQNPREFMRWMQLEANAMGSSLV